MYYENKQTNETYFILFTLQLEKPTQTPESPFIHVICLLEQKRSQTKIHNGHTATESSIRSKIRNVL